MEHRAAVGALERARGQAQVVQVARLFEHAVAVRQAGRADHRLARAPEAAVQAHVVVHQPTPAGVGLLRVSTDTLRRTSPGGFEHDWRTTTCPARAILASSWRLT